MQKKILSSIILIFVLFLLLATFWNGTIFASDEEEIFLKGRAIASGIELYTEIGTQHMPLMYYIAALFALLGVESITAFRLCFYFLMALLWGVCYLRYSSRFGKTALTLYPLIYIVLMAYISEGHTILSEQFSGIGMAILFFELLLFQSDRTLKMGNYIMISLAIFISFGSAFVSIFAIFAVFLTVLWLELDSIFHQKINFGVALQVLFKKYWKLILVVMAPFAIMMVYFIITESMDEFWGWAYTLNREIYPKYLGGYGGTILKSMFDGIAYFADELRVSTLNANAAVKLVIFFLAILFLLHQYRVRKSKILTIGLVFFLITAATRGVFNFHGLPVIALLSAMIAVCLSDNFSTIRDICSRTNPRKAFVILCVFIFCAPYLSVFPNLFALTLEEQVVEDSLSSAVDALTDSGERVGFGTTEYDVLLEADVFPATVTSGSCPWLWEWAGEQAMAELEAAPPKVYIFNKNLKTWGYKIKDYAPELCTYIDTYYTSLSKWGYPTLYVHNSYYREAIQILDSSTVLSISGTSQAISLRSGTTFTQTFPVFTNVEIESLRVVVGTHARTNNCTLKVVLLDQTTNKSIEIASADCADMEDNISNSIYFPSQQLQAGHIYSVEFSIPDATENDFIAIYCDNNGADSEVYATVDGQIQEFNFCMEIYSVEKD